MELQLLKRKKVKVEEKGSQNFLSIGYQLSFTLVFSVVSFSFLGMIIDKKLHTPGIFFGIGFAFAVVGSFYKVYMLTKKIFDEEAQKPQLPEKKAPE